MMDLERPMLRTRHADWCTYDLTGRLLNFYIICTDGIDGKHTDKLTELYERIMNNRRPTGVFGNNEGGSGSKFDKPEGANQFICGLVNYYSLKGDIRALNAAEQLSDFVLAQGDAFFNKLITDGPHVMQAWICEAFAVLYRETGKEKYLDAVKRIAKDGVGKTLDGSYAHGYLTTLRGFLKAAIYSGDDKLAELVSKYRQNFIDKQLVHANGDIPECFEDSHRNEGCAIADWIMLNLYYGYIYDDNLAYEMAEHSLWNALYFNQFVTGGFGHRHFAKDKSGYTTYIEEAWWCCAETAGLCLSEVARHTVSVRNGKLKLNYFIPGEYTVKLGGKDVKVTITSKYPLEVETYVVVDGTKENIDLRIPDFMKNVTVDKTETDFGYRLYIDGIMGYYTEKSRGGNILKHGPLMLAPMIYTWNMNNIRDNSTVPDGYTHQCLPNDGATLITGEPDEFGFLKLQHGDLPTWSVFEEGELAGISGGEVASCHVPMRFADGKVRDLFFQPLCSATSNLTLMDIPIEFEVSEK